MAVAERCCLSGSLSVSFCRCLSLSLSVSLSLSFSDSIAPLRGRVGACNGDFLVRATHKRTDCAPASAVPGSPMAFDAKSGDVLRSAERVRCERVRLRARLLLEQGASVAEIGGAKSLHVRATAHRTIPRCALNERPGPRPVGQPPSWGVLLCRCGRRRGESSSRRSVYRLLARVLRRTFFDSVCAR